MSESNELAFETWFSDETVFSEELHFDMTEDGMDKLIRHVAHTAYLAGAAQATPPPQSVREALEKAAEVCGKLVDSIGDSHSYNNTELTCCDCAEIRLVGECEKAILALIEPLSAADVDDEANLVTVDKRDLFDFVRAEIMDALENDDNCDKQAELWSDATDRAIACLSKLYDGVIPAAATGGQESEAQAVGETYVEHGSGTTKVRWIAPAPAGTKLYTAPPSALAIDAAAKMQAAEVCKKRAAYGCVSGADNAVAIHNEILATIPQDGITALAEYRKQTRLESLLEAAREADNWGEARQREYGGAALLNFADELRRMAEGEK